jgi:hypothetical protein
MNGTGFAKPPSTHPFLEIDDVKKHGGEKQLPTADASTSSPGRDIYERPPASVNGFLKIP